MRQHRLSRPLACWSMEALEPRVLLHAMGSGTEAHQWIVEQAIALYSQQFAGGELATYIGSEAGSHLIPGSNNTLLEGTADEDVNLFQDGTWENPFGQWEPFLRHFCAGGDGSELDDGWLGYDSAATQASRYWGTYVVGRFAAARGASYYYLGHVAHLLADMTVPAHVHNDEHGTAPDAYEDWIAAGARFRNYVTGSPLGPNTSWSIVLPSTLRSLFELTADYTEDYRSDDGAGEAAAEYPAGYRQASRHHPESVTGTGDLTASQCAVVGADLMPWAIEQTAALFRFFYSQVDTTPPSVRISNLVQHDPGNPEVTYSPTILVDSAAEDPESGVGVGLYTFEYQQKAPGGDWSSWQTFAQGGDITTFTGTSGYTYGFRVKAQSGAGSIGTSDVSYVLVRICPPGDANRDTTVDLQDFGILKDNFGTTEGGTWEQGDFNGDAAIDLQDFGILKDHFGQSAPLEAAAVPAAPAPLPVVPPPADGEDPETGLDILDALAAVEPRLMLQAPAWP